MAVNSGLVMVGFLGIAFVVYMVVKDKIFVMGEEGFEHPARAPIQVMTASYSPPKQVVSSGPSAPSQEAPRGEVVVHGDPAPRDPLAEDESSSTAAPKMTYPERSFRPAPPNDQVQLAREAGIAGPSGQNSPQAYQKFGTDAVQNSGEFYNGVYANDTFSDSNFSAF
jgi:hypothetical protein